MEKLRVISPSEILQGEILGRGSFGVVLRGLWKNKKVALKYFSSPKDKKAFLSESKTHSSVSHPNIIQIFGIVESLSEGFLVLEFADCGSLYSVLHNRREIDYKVTHALFWALDCAQGVEYLHTLKPFPIIHRDLKSPNLLLVSRGLSLKICDFGTACTQATIMTNNKGSAAWMAPEVFEGNTYCEKCDVFSFGVILWEILTRRIPFEEIGGNDLRILWAIHSGRRPPLLSKAPSLLNRLLSDCWDKEMSRRPPMTEVVKILRLLTQYTTSVDHDPIFSSSSSSFSPEEMKETINGSLEEEEEGSFISALTSMHPKSEGYFTPPEDEECILELPSIDTKVLRNAPSELLRIWTESSFDPHIPSIRYPLSDYRPKIIPNHVETRSQYSNSSSEDSEQNNIVKQDGTSSSSMMNKREKRIKENSIEESLSTPELEWSESLIETEAENDKDIISFF